jgi:hypothetical protein
MVIRTILTVDLKAAGVEGITNEYRADACAGAADESVSIGPTSLAIVFSAPDIIPNYPH